MRLPFRLLPIFFLLILFYAASTLFAQAGTISVTIFTDEFNATPDTGCSLREAVEAANTGAAFGGCDLVGSAPYTIVLTGGTYTLTLGTSEDDTNASDDLDFFASMTIRGTGPESTFIRVEGLRERVIDIREQTAIVNLNLLALTNGDPDFGGGSAVFNEGTLILTDVAISQNRSVNRFPAIDNLGSMTINRGSISANFGGAIGNAGVMTVNNTTITDHTESNATIFNAGTLNLQKSTVSANTALSTGGVRNFGGTLNITDSTLSNNTAVGRDVPPLGATVNNDQGGTTQITNSTIVFNINAAAGFSESQSGGLYNTDGNLTVTNSIVSGNIRQQLADDGFTILSFDEDCGGTVASGGYNLFGSGGAVNGCPTSVATDLIAAGETSTIVMPLADNSGPTHTHALTIGSAAIDAGNCPNGTDQRGLPRPMDQCDIGAFEIQTSGPVVYDVDTVADLVSASACTDAPDDCSLRGAISRVNDNPAQDDVTINLPAGTYTLTQGTAPEDNNQSGDLDISGNVAIIGTGSGQTTIQACAEASCPDADRVFHIDPADSGAIVVSIRDLTVTKGNSTQEGGGIYSNTELTLTNVAVNNNISAVSGGGLFTSIGAQTTVMNSSFSGNRGGGVHNSGGMVLVDSMIFDNISLPNGGGGILNEGTLSIGTSTISNNQGDDQGVGGIRNNGDMTLMSSAIRMNIATDMTAGIRNAGEMTIFSSLISGNSAELGPGGIQNSGGILTVTNSTISGNNAGFDGAGLMNSLGSVTIAASTITANTSESGTVGGVANNSTMTVYNSIITGNTNADCGGGLPIVSGGYNIFGSADSANGCPTSETTDIIPGLEGVLLPLADNSGPTNTHALVTGGPAVDAGDPNFDGTAFDPALIFDQRGPEFDRVFDGRVDIGAYETQPMPTPTPTPEPTMPPTLEPTEEATPGVTQEPTASPTPEITPTAEPTTGAESIQPGTMQVRGDLDRGPVYPMFIWAPDADGDPQPGDWYNIVVTDSDDTEVFLDEWFEAAEVCLRGVCEVETDSQLLPTGMVNGAYNWRVRAWTEEYMSDYSRAEYFEVNTVTPALLDVINVTVDSGRPVITFRNDPNIAWLHIYIGNGSTIHQQWYEKTRNRCTESICTLLLDANPVNGQYSLHAQAWGPSGFNNNDRTAWSQPYDFTLDLPPAGDITPVQGTLMNGAPSVLWNGGENATWYRVWIGTDEPDYTTWHDQWYSAFDLGCGGGGLCTLQFNTPAAADAAEIWYVQAWGPGGTDLDVGTRGWQYGGELLP